MIRVRYLVIALGLSACAVKGSGSMQVETTGGVVYQEPPPPQVETVEVRPGFVWIKGRYQWRNGQWAWVGGHWERERAGYVWTEGRWEHRGNQWVWVEGSWAVSSQPATTVTVTTAPPPTVEVRDHRTPEPAPPPGPVVRDHRDGGGAAVGATVTISAYPTAAPPPVRVENPGTKGGFVWVAGHWNWKNGAWDWENGHWERERANMVWTAGRWELQGGRYVWIEGKWEAGAPGPTVRDHRH